MNLTQRPLRCRKNLTCAIVHIMFQLTCMTVDDVQFLYKLSTSSSSPDIRGNVIRIVSAIGLALSKQQEPHPMMKVSRYSFFFVEAHGQGAKALNSLHFKI